MNVRSFIIGVFYNGLSRYYGLLINLLLTSVLARMISPLDFGIIAITQVFIVFFSIIGDIGIGAAVIQNKKLTAKDINNIFSFTLLLSTVLSLIFYSSSHLIGKYYESDLLTIAVKYLSVNLFFSVLNTVPYSLLIKEKRFKFISARNIIIQTVCFIVAIFLAYSGFGIYSLIFHAIFSSILTFIVNYYSVNIKIQKLNSLESLKKIYKFSSFQFLFSITNYFSRNLDNILIGKYIGLTSLGYYEKSYRLMVLPVTNLTNVLNSIIHPYFSEYQTDILKINRLYEVIVRLLSFIGFSISIFLFSSASEIILIIYGDKWVESIGVFKILSLSVGFQVIVSSAGGIFQSTNNTKLLFIDGVLSTIITLTSILVGVFLFGDLKSISKLLVLSFVINFFKSYFILYRFVFNNEFTNFLKLLVYPLLCSLILFVLLSIYNNYFNVENIYGNIVIKIFVFSFSMLVFSLLNTKYNFIKILKNNVRK